MAANILKRIARLSLFPKYNLAVEELFRAHGLPDRRSHQPEAV
jgi:hypothetical protein